MEVRVEDVLRDLQAIDHTDLQTLSVQSGVPARWADKLKALELLRMTDDQLQEARDAYTVLAGIQQQLEHGLADR